MNREGGSALANLKGVVIVTMIALYGAVPFTGVIFHDIRPYGTVKILEASPTMELYARFRLFTLPL